MLQRSQAWLRLLETAELALPYRRCSQRGQARRASPARPRGSPLNALWKWRRGLGRAASTEPNVSWHAAWPITSGVGSAQLRGQQRVAVGRSEGAAASLPPPEHIHRGSAPPRTQPGGAEGVRTAPQPGSPAGQDCWGPTASPPTKPGGF